MEDRMLTISRAHFVTTTKRPEEIGSLSSPTGGEPHLADSSPEAMLRRTGRSVRRLAEQRVSQIPFTIWCVGSSGRALPARRRDANGSDRDDRAPHELTASLRLSGLRHKYDDVRCAQFGLWRGARRAHPRHGAVTDEQRSHRPNSAQPGGRQVFFAQTSLLAPYRSTAGYARRSRLVWAKNPLPRTSSYLCLTPLSQPVVALETLK